MYFRVKDTPHWPDLAKGRHIMKPENTLWTVARIAAYLGVDRHRIEYLIDARGIKPIARAGIARIFAPADVDRLTHEIAKINADREGGAL